MSAFSIGEAARRSGVSAKMIRYYEAQRLLPRVARTPAGYRQYSERDVHVLRFIRRARDLGFGIADIAALLRLWVGRRPSREVKRIAQARMRELEARIADLESMHRTLARLAHACHGDERPDCPILDDLSLEGPPATPAARPARPARQR